MFVPVNSEANKYAHKKITNGEVPELPDIMDPHTDCANLLMEVLIYADDLPLETRYEAARYQYFLANWKEASFTNIQKLDMRFANLILLAKPRFANVPLNTKSILYDMLYEYAETCTGNVDNDTKTANQETSTPDPNTNPEITKPGNPPPNERLDIEKTHLNINENHSK